MKYADLHIHTNFSDGTFTPQEVVRQAHQNGLSAIAITDHDIVSGIEPAIKAAKNFALEIIPGIELSAEADNYEIHILGYFIDWRRQWFQDKLKQICRVRNERATTILEKLKSYGINLDQNELLRQGAFGSVGRLHIAQMMLKKGFISSIQEAFNKYIGNGRPCYVKKFKLTPAEAIEMIRSLKGLAVLAHPYHIGNDEIIPDLVRSGLIGIEAYSADEGNAAMAHYRKIAEEYGLLITGGSDCHGLGKDKPLIGEVKIPYSLVEALKEKVGLSQYGSKKS